MSREGSRTIEERVSYAVGHRVRIEVLAALHERSYSAIELSRIVKQPLSLVTHHVEALLKDGAIEIGHTRKRRSIEQNFYRPIKLAFFTDEEMEAMGVEDRQRIYGTILEAVMAEALASFWAGKIAKDPRAFLAWRWYNVDEKGREEIADEQRESWERVQEIEARSLDRAAASGEETTSIIVSVLGYERSRSAPHPPADYLG
ncbi:MAG TPA: winged helix-turn-helix domain-containing protein [Edaphobacter sp.]|nr:winged helix-turn-helix domain-containing protein [Edaphobacter sp.]